MEDIKQDIMEKFELNISDVKFENKEDFEIMVISPNNIEEYDYNHPGYITKLINQDFNKIVKCSTDNFFEKIAEGLNINDFDANDRNVVWHVIYDKPEYFYEILFLDVLDKNKHTKTYQNQFASMINTYGEPVYGNMIILKTYIPNDKDKSMILGNMDKSDLFEIMDSRVNTKVVIFEDGEYRQDVVRGDMDVYCKNLFEESFFQKKELSFLMHNINIYYLKDEYGSVISKNLIPDKIEKAVIFTMTNNQIRGNITLDEVKKIVELSKDEQYFKPKKEWIEDEKDSYDRDVIKNKYKILEYAWKDYQKNNSN
tara:strand:- start:1091 stop:2026 length:936 start_codon:yes stop_codon:yes gene_type:complete